MLTDQQLQRLESSAAAQAALVNEAKAFTKRAWRSEAAAALLRQLNVTVDTVWAAACSCNLYYR